MCQDSAFKACPIIARVDELRDHSACIHKVYILDMYVLVRVLNKREFLDKAE